MNLADLTPLVTPPADLSPRATGIAAHLPSVLQLDQVWWIMAICLATVCALKTLPDKLRKPWILQLATMIVAVGFALWLVGRAGAVYAVGAGVIGSSLTTSFYDLFFSALEAKLRSVLNAFFGIAPTPSFDPAIPRPSAAQSPTEKTL